MNIYGKDIMKLLKVDEEMAQKVLTEMEMHQFFKLLSGFNIIVLLRFQDYRDVLCQRKF